MSNAGGSQSGSEFGVNITTQNSQYIPGITAPSDGRFVIPWTDWSRTGGDTSQAAIRPQICDPRGAAVNLACSALRDDIVGTAFGDTMQGMAGNDHLLGRAATIRGLAGLALTLSSLARAAIMTP